MSSTYSTNLAIELIGSGEQAGNWGSTTNTNLGTLLEQAISGYTTYSCTGGTDTLIMTNGADATARNMYIQLSGTGGGTLVVPGTYPNANKKLYFIYNSTASAITVKVSGQTGVSVPAAAKIALVCNGSDIVVAENYMVSPTLSSPTLTGTPLAPTASVGTSTQQIATTAFVQAAGLTGEIKMWGVSSAPTGYLLCDGTAVSRTTYAALFAVYGTTFGSGNGTTTFNVPDFRDRMPIGAGSTYALAATGGSATTTISTSNLPSHTHTFSATSGSPNTSLNHRHYVGSRDSTADNGGNYAQEFVSDAGSGYGPNTYTNYQDLSHTHDISGTTGSAGSGTAATTISPYLGIYYIIKT
jgi:microcystin-dependent protein